MQITVAKAILHSGDSAEVEIQPGQWTAIHVPAVSVQATATQAAAGTGTINVVTFISAALVADTTAPAAAQVTVNLIDGASGGTTYLWREQIGLTATAGQTYSINLSGLNIPGSKNTQTTLEFSAGAGAHTFESITFGGYTLSG